MAVVNIAALGMLADGPDLGTASPLLVLPALWLGLAMGLRGAALAIGAVLAFITVPGLVAHGTDAVTLERLIVLPVVAGVGAASITAGLSAARAAQARAEAREAELEAAMEVIERSRRSAHAIFEAVDVGLALLDRNGQPMLINHRLAEFSELAYPAGNVADGWVFDESGTVRLDIDDVPTSRARRGEEFDDVRVWVGEQEERRRAMSISARRVEHADGSLVGAAISYTDVTDFMRALQVKDDFIALVSHELRTPLTSIVGYVAVILERTDLDPGLRKHLDVVARNGRRLQQLVGDLLEEVQQTGHPAPLREQDTDLAAIVRDSVVAARPSATRAGVVLEVDAPDAIAFTGDPQRLAQVVDNLVSNAIKYTGLRRAGRGAGVHRRRVCRDPGPRHRDRDQARGPGPAVHPVLPHPRGDPERDPGRRARPLHQQVDRREPRRPDRGRQRARPRQRVPRRTPAPCCPARVVMRLVWLRGEPDPRVLQLGFTMLLVAEACLRVARWRPALPDAGWWTPWCSPRSLTVVVWCVPARWRRATIPVIADRRHRDRRGRAAQRRGRRPRAAGRASRSLAGPPVRRVGRPRVGRCEHCC